MDDASSPRERWRPVVGYERLYEVSDHGRVRRAVAVPGYQQGHILHQVRIKKGYWTVKLSQDRKIRRRRVHRLVAEAFLGTPPVGYESNHKDGDKNNNRLSNLEWVTPEQNRDHAHQMGLVVFPRGEASPWAKLTVDQVREIRRLASTETHAVTARRFGISRDHVKSIRRRRVWRHLG